MMDLTRRVIIVKGELRYVTKKGAEVPIATLNSHCIVNILNQLDAAGKHETNLYHRLSEEVSRRVGELERVA